MLRKILATLLAVCMVASAFVAVSAENQTVCSINENYDNGIGDTLKGTDITITTGTAGGRDGVLIVNSSKGTGAYGLVGFAAKDINGTQYTQQSLPKNGVITYSLDIFVPSEGGNMGDAAFYLRTQDSFPPSGMMVNLDSLDNLPNGTWKTYSGTKNVADFTGKWSGVTTDNLPVWICLRPNFTAAGTFYVDNFSFTITTPIEEEEDDDEESVAIPHSLTLGVPAGKQGENSFDAVGAISDGEYSVMLKDIRKYTVDRNGSNTSAYGSDCSHNAWLKVVFDEAVETSGKWYIAFDFESKGITNSAGSEYSTVTIRPRFYNGSTEACNHSDHAQTVVANTGEPVKVVVPVDTTKVTGPVTDIRIAVDVSIGAKHNTFPDNGYFTISNVQVATGTYKESVEPEEPETPAELPPFRDTPVLANGATEATPEEIATLGVLPEGIGKIYKQTVTIGSGNTSTVDLLYYPNALTREGDYDLKAFLFEPETNPATDGTGLHRMLRYSRFSSSHAWRADIAYVLYEQDARMGVWNTYDGKIVLDKTNDKVAPAYTTDRIGFRWNIGSDGWKGGADHPYPEIVGQTATIYYSISLTSGVQPSKADVKIETTKWSGENLFDEAGYLASSGAVTETIDGEKVISAGSNYNNVGAFANLVWDNSRLYRITFKAKGDPTATYNANGRVQFRTSSSTEFTKEFPAADLRDGQWHEYSMICDMSTLEQTFKDGNGMLCDRGTAGWWVMLRRGIASEGPVYYKDIVIEYAVPTEEGDTPVYTSAIFTYKNNDLETFSIPSGVLILAEYNSDGTFNRAITKKFAKNEETTTLKKKNTADSETYEGQIGGILPDMTGAARIDIPGYDASKTYQAMVWDSVIGMNSLFGVTASK